MAARLLVFCSLFLIVSLLSPVFAQTPIPAGVSSLSTASPSASSLSAKDLALFRLKGHIDEEERITERLHNHIQRLRENGVDVGQLEKEYTVLASAALDIDKAYAIVLAGTQSASAKGQAVADFKEKVRLTVKHLQAALNSQKRLIQLMKALPSFVPAVPTASGE